MDDRSMPRRHLSGNSVTVRRCGPDDVDQVAHLATLMGRADSEEKVARRIGLTRGRPDHLLCIADLAGAVIGYAWAQDYGPHLRDGESVIRIHDLFVRPPERRHGIGSGLFSHVRDWTAGRGAAYIQWQASPGALPFYSALGLVGDPCPDPGHPSFEIALERPDRMG